MSGTVEQREAAREKANAYRLARARLKREVKAGRKVSEVLSSEIPDWLEGMPIIDLLDAIPYCKRSSQLDFLEVTGHMSEKRRIGHITARQLPVLATVVAEWEIGREERVAKRARSHQTLLGSRRSKAGAQ